MDLDLSRGFVEFDPDAGPRVGKRANDQRPNRGNDRPFGNHDFTVAHACGGLDKLARSAGRARAARTRLASPRAVRSFRRASPSSPFSRAYPRRARQSTNLARTDRRLLPHPADDRPAATSRSPRIAREVRRFDAQRTARRSPRVLRRGLAQPPKTGSAMRLSTTTPNYLRPQPTRAILTKLS